MSLLPLVAGCASSGTSDKAIAQRAVPDIPMQKSLGKGEGELNIIAWAGYVENGSTTPR